MDFPSPVVAQILAWQAAMVKLYHGNHCHAHHYHLFSFSCQRCEIHLKSDYLKQLISEMCPTAPSMHLVIISAIGHH